MPENVSLKPRQTAAIVALLSGANLEQAARAANVNVRTLRRWMNTDFFRAELDQAQGELSRQAARKLANLLTDSVDELAKLLKTANLDPVTKLRVINTILGAWPKIHEVTILDERLNRIEELLQDEQ